MELIKKATLRDEYVRVKKCLVSLVFFFVKMQGNDAKSMCASTRVTTKKNNE